MNVGQPPKRKSSFNEEFDVMQAIQEDRMAFHASINCHERCVSNYYFNNFYWREKTCMQNCLDKINQATVITNINYGKFEDVESKK
ncbi:putative mitochondrial mitochondrial translocase subunit [Leptomonas pyrrhocoris]|uniref:Mitochondrial import inner membrane translocase subunit n=1 Tax=Leptomonas pyrrhocoris TaxID=157538 RepID=A0A0M9FZG8_LEPPY|nr:putative mitochondrial mitochondrial translocase subunit [Leptomonas pyrrhocoris]KPA79089.1 putative mitochondrial mitochondrial translocase subunit [Leptomonas pyrrhocoris]|eukprot:XP_015657528.1 putative mitochondrial mitochondrial translocase subunit [Leptomonas pyrrhocoris]